MKLFLIILLLGLIQFTNIYSQNNSGYSTDSLFVVWNNGNYEGKEDCSASASISSDSNTINITVRVSDDVLVFNKDSLNSDHIELWFALPDIPDIYLSNSKVFSNKFIFGDSSIYPLENNQSLEDFKSIILNPTITNSDSADKTISYSQIDTTSFNWLKNDIDRYLYDARNSNLYTNKFFFGLVHFGILPNSINAIQYNTEYYSPLEKYLNIKIADLTKFISYTKQIYQNGYMCNISISCEALGFVTKYGIDRLRFLIDVVDVDKTGKQENILSTSKNRTSDNLATFNVINFRNKIKVNVFQNIPSLRVIDDKEPPYNVIFNCLPEEYVFTTNGWIPVKVSKGYFMSFDEDNTDLFYGYGTEYYLKNISKIYLEKYKIDYHFESRHNNSLEYFDCSYPFFGQQLLVVNSALLLNPKQIIESFLLPNGNMAFLYTESETTGRHYEYLYSSLYLITDSLKELIAKYDGYSYNKSNNDRSFIIPFSNIDVMKKWDYEHYDYDWIIPTENVRWDIMIKHNNNDTYLILDLSKGLKYYIEWDNNGKIINAVEE